MLLDKRLIELLLAVPSEPILALQLMTKIVGLEGEGKLNGLVLVDFAPDIERAIVEIGDLAHRSERITNQCLEIKPKPAHRVPIGF